MLFKILLPAAKTRSDPSVGRSVISISSKYASSSGIMINGSSTKALRTDASINSPIDCAKYSSSLSLICANAEFGAVITCKITFRSKEDKS